MVIKFLYKILLFVFAGSDNGLPGLSVDNPNAPVVNETHSPIKMGRIVAKKDSVSQTQIPIIIFNLINTNHQNASKSAGSLKHAGKVARTVNNHLPTGKI